MRFFRLSIVVFACTSPLLWSSCSRREQPVQTAELSQDAAASISREASGGDPPGAAVPEEAVPEEAISTETIPAEANEEATAAESDRGKPAASPSEASFSDASSIANGREGDTQAKSSLNSSRPDPSASRPQVEERKSSSAARAKGEINFDDLKFDLEKDQPFREDLLTEEIRQLDGSKVKLRGYILPATLFSETNISQFVLVRDNQECCFGPGAALFDCVMVEMVPGKTTDFVTRPVTVEGKFVIDIESYRYPPGYSPSKATHMAVFRIEGESVQ